MQTDVLVVGAGPVGLTLAIDLAQRGVQVTIVEKNPAPLYLPKMERSNPRTMEIYRRLGLADTIRAAALPADKPMSAMVVHSFAEPPLLTHYYPSVQEMRELIAADSEGLTPLEPYQLVSQYTLEPILIDAARNTPNLTLFQSTQLTDLEQDAEGVTATVESSDGKVQSIRARYLAGCDGGSGVVRKLLGVGMQGQPAVGELTSIFFRCDDLLEKSQMDFARHYSIAGVDMGGGAAGAIVVQDDMKHFALNMHDAGNLDPVAVVRKVTGLDITPEILYTGPWTQHLLVAEQHSVGRVFLAGDSNHLFIPAGGLGMNTGIVDAINLSWKLAATLQGWGGPALLDSYHTERSAAAKRNLEAVRWALEGVKVWREAYNPRMLEDTPEGRAARQAFVELADPANRRVYEMHGADRGYAYQSAIVTNEEEPAPPCPFLEFVPSTKPGSHLPHAWLSTGKALYDSLGKSCYALLLLNGDNTGAEQLRKAFAAFDAPLDVISIDAQHIRELYERDLILVRPDLHIAWRGNALPTDPMKLAAVVTGHGNVATGE